MTARVVLHLPDAYHDRFHAAPHLALHARIDRLLRARGGKVVIADRPAHLFTGGTVDGDGDLHIVEGGWVRGEGWLNAGLAYLPGYWHLDPQGVLCDSSIGARLYDPGSIGREEADAFLSGLRARFALPRLSRYRQAREVAEVPGGSIGVFLQGRVSQRRGQSFATSREMLRAVASAADGRPVVVKAHPLWHDPGLKAIASVISEGHLLYATDANVHDILAACDVTVSINSAASIEGMMHGKPAILFGRSDFAVLVETVTDVGQFPAALSRALAGQRDYAKALTWYFDRNCLWLDAPDFPRRLWALMEQAGFGPERLGLRPN